MAETSDPKDVKLIVGQIVTDESLFSSIRERLESLYGPTDLESDVFPFDYTNYYRDRMGEGLKRKFLSTERLIRPGKLADIKLRTNELEKELARETDFDVSRPVNLDPGYVGASKLVLATTKNYSHRIYLEEGIYGEVTLQYKNGSFEPFPWTYPDYKTDEYRNFFERVRGKYMDQLRGESAV